MNRMSSVELAVRKVKKLSDRQARDLLGWLASRPSAAVRQPTRSRRTKRPRTMKELKAWQDSVRGTTDWEPPRMPDDLVKPFRF